MDNIYKQESGPRYRNTLQKSKVGVLPFFLPKDWKMTNSLLEDTLARSGNLMASFTRPPPMFTRQCERASGILHPCPGNRLLVSYLSPFNIINEGDFTRKKKIFDLVAISSIR